MKKKIKNLIRKYLKKTRIRIVNHDNFLELLKKERLADDLSLLKEIDRERVGQMLDFLPKSKSENRQDLFVLSQTKFKRNGLFVEFGATNGMDISNTYLLEKEFSWHGILAEPAKCWHRQIAFKQKCAY